MKKNEETQKEVKSKLVWRLKTTPTVDEVQTLLEKEVISKDEAREILFKVEQEEQEEPTSLSELKKEIEFLRGLILQVMQNGSKTTIVKYMESPQWTPYRHEWLRPYYVTAQSLPNNTVFTMLSTADGTSYTTGTLNMSGAQSGGSTIKAIKAMENGEFNGSSDSNNRFIS